MSASPDTSPFDQNHSEISDNEPSATTPSSLPRIKLKIRLNPTPSYSDHDHGLDDTSAKKHKRKKKRSHKKHKHAKHSDDNDKAHGQHRRHSEVVDIDDYDDDGEDYNDGMPLVDSTPHTNGYPEYQHVPVGGKRPFAMLQQPDDETDLYSDKKTNPHLYEENGYTDDDGNDDYEYEDDYDESALDETNTYHPTDTTTAATKKIKPNKAGSKSKKASKQLASLKLVEPKKRGRPTKKAQAKASLAAHPPQQYMSARDYKKELKATCIKLWDNLSKRDDYGFFLEPVNTKLVRDYLTVIKRPMDFSTQRRKIENDSYTTMDDFRKDFLLIVQNAKLYNAPDTIYWKSADKLESYGIKAIDRAEKLLQESLMTPSRTHNRKDSTTVKEEEVDILGLDGPARKASRAESERTTREPSLDTPLSRATTPMRQLSKKKKKKMTDAGVIYGPDGSIHAVGGINDPHLLLPTKPSFSDPPQLTTINPQALPSAFYQPNRSIHDDWANHKHFVQPSVFCDYGPFPFTTLGSSTPAMFYRPQDAHYVFSLYGDDTGEAYMKSVWQFMGDLGLDDKAASISRYITRGGYDIMTTVIDNMDMLTEKKMDDDIDIDNDDTNSPNDNDSSLVVDTEFGAVDVGAILKGLQDTIDGGKGKSNTTEAQHIDPSSLPSSTETAVSSS